MSDIIAAYEAGIAIVRAQRTDEEFINDIIGQKAKELQIPEGIWIYLSLYDPIFLEQKTREGAIILV